MSDPTTTMEEVLLDYVERYGLTETARRFFAEQQARILQGMTSTQRSAPCPVKNNSTSSPR